MTKVKILQLGSLSDSLNARLNELYDITRHWQNTDPTGWLASKHTEFEGIVTSARFGCTSAMMDALPNLKVICSFGVGYESLDIDHAQALSIPVSNTPDVLNDCVADLAMGLMIGVSRRLAQSDTFVRAGHWSKGAFPLARSVHHKRLGIVGLGRVGNAIARRAAGFDMEIAYFNRKAVTGSPYPYFSSVTALAEWADFLVLSCVGGPSTLKLIGRDQLAALGPQGVLINVSRGTVVDEEALIDALSTGTLGGAGLDVYVNEPDVPDALKALPNTLLLPHVGSATAETRRAMEALVLENLTSFLSHGRLVTPILRKE